MMSTTTEVDNWVAIQDLLFKKPNTTLQVVEHACGHLGWGNSMRGFFNTIGFREKIDNYLPNISSHVYCSVQGMSIIT